MKWSSALEKKNGDRSTLAGLIEKLANKIKDELDGQAPDFAVGFLSPQFQDDFDRFPELVDKAISPKSFIGCSAGGLIGDGQELEKLPGVALTAAVLPEVNVSAFHLNDDDLPDPDAGPDCWEKALNVASGEDPAFIVLPDPFTFRIDALVRGMDFAFPRSIKVGGLASGADRPGLNRLFMNREVLSSGVVGVAMTGNLVVDTVVAQGCRPIGTPLTVTKCEKNFLYEIDGKSAVKVLHDVLVSLPEKDQELAKNSLFLGVVMDEFKQEVKPGDFLVRNIIGLEPTSGALVVGELLRNERTIQFHLRDAATSADDLRLLLKDHCETKSKDASGALLFSCLGRGKYLYGLSNHDSNCFKQYFGEIPLGGFFCNGEIGPVGGTTFLHGYTSSFGIFRAKSLNPCPEVRATGG